MIQQKIIRILGFLFVMVALFGCEKMRVDAQMKEMCKKDGGMKIYEKVMLPKDQFTKYGDVNFFETWNTSGGGYRFEAPYERLKSNKPTLTRYTYSVVREADKKILGTYIIYSRIGGDILWRPGPDSSVSCPVDGNSTNFLRAIFVQANQVK